MVKFGMLYLLSYVFLLRLPSEAIPVRAHRGDFHLHIDGSFLTVHLAHRKNKLEGSRMVRRCWCSQCKSTCPIHVLGPWLGTINAGDPLFAGVTAACALRTLRALLRTLNVPHADEYRTHDLRRGHAKDLQLSGALNIAHEGSTYLALGNKVPHCGKSYRQGSGGHPHLCSIWTSTDWKRI